MQLAITLFLNLGLRLLLINHLSQVARFSLSKATMQKQAMHHHSLYFLHPTLAYPSVIKQDIVQDSNLH